MERHAEWLYKAENDVESAAVLFNAKLNDTSIYHTQQCAEKALKGYIVYKGVLAPKTHDLDKLLDLCKHFDSSFNSIDLIVFELNGLDVKFRYPSPDLDPPEADVKNCIEWANEILDFVKSKCI
jgi:HEPN domain-containing protein